MGYLLVTSFFLSVNRRASSLSIEEEKSELPIYFVPPTRNRDASSRNLDPSPTAETRKRLTKFITNDRSDLLNDGTYLIDPDHHYVDPKKLRVIDYDGLEGKYYIWDVVLKARLPHVGEDAIRLLNALHYFFAPKIKSKERDNIRVLHVQKCLFYLDEGLNGNQTKDESKIVVKRMIMLLKQFLELFSSTEGVNSKTESDAPFFSHQSHPPAPKRNLARAFNYCKELEPFTRETFKPDWNKLFGWLHNPTIGAAMWNILSLLPPSQMHQQQVVELAIGAGYMNNRKKLRELFDMNGTFIALYYLQILSGILT